MAGFAPAPFVPVADAGAPATQRARERYRAFPPATTVDDMYAFNCGLLAATVSMFEFASPAYVDDMFVRFPAYMALMSARAGFPASADKALCSRCGDMSVGPDRKCAGCASYQAHACVKLAKELPGATVPPLRATAPSNSVLGSEYYEYGYAFGTCHAAHLIRGHLNVDDHLDSWQRQASQQLTLPKIWEPRLLFQGSGAFCERCERGRKDRCVAQKKKPENQWCMQCMTNWALARLIEEPSKENDH